MSMNMHHEKASGRLEQAARQDGWIQRLEQARQRRDHLEMARLLLAAADQAMAEAGPDDETLEHAQWLLARTQRSVSATGSHAEGIRATAELLEAMDRLLRMWVERDRPAAARLAIEQVRDTAFDLARRVERSEDLGLRCTLLLRTENAALARRHLPASVRVHHAQRELFRSRSTVALSGLLLLAPRPRIGCGLLALVGRVAQQIPGGYAPRLRFLSSLASTALRCSGVSFLRARAALIAC